MKRITAIAICAISALGLSVGVQAQERALKVNIPFAFAVGDNVLPPSTYNITSPTSGVVLIRSVDSRSAAFSITTHGEQEKSGKSKLVFTRYGDRYFLHHIKTPMSRAMNVDVPTSKLEKRVRSERLDHRGDLAFLEIK